MQSNQDGERKMFQGNWKCGTCDEPIRELPFEPNPRYLNRLLCKACFKNKQK